MILRLVDRILLPFTVLGLLAGAVADIGGRTDLADTAWAAPTILVATRLLVAIVADLRKGKTGVDVIALLAMAGALILGEFLAGSVIGVMLATGQALERYAEGRAERELSSLLSRAPRVVHRHEGDELTSPPIDDVRVGDLLLVKPGEIVPVDGLVATAPATLDESALTGESRLVTREIGVQVASGTVNAGSPFDLRAIATAEGSTYAGVIRLVREAKASKAPFVRLADRYALLFLPLTLGISGVAWLASGDPVRALAVLVVATPCPLLLAAPIAIVGGISRSARRGIIVKGGGALETLARARIVLFDKTGTLTAGTPQLAEVEPAPGQDCDEVLRLAASVEQVSPHVLAGAIVQAAIRRGLLVSFPSDVVEQPGAGISGVVDGYRVMIGNEDWVSDQGPLPSWARDVRRRTTMEAGTNVFVQVDGELTGALVLVDPIRPETPRAIRLLRRAGIERIVMVTGDHPVVAETIAAAIGVDRVLAERSPAEKVEALAAERADAVGAIVMVGDGINDAPALAAADVGVAMGARGATASSEAADVVILVDRLDRLAEAILIASRARTIAIQSVLLGMGLSLVAMVAAAFGLLLPVIGALLQEGIDVLVILNALRALQGARIPTVKIVGWTETSERLRAEHPVHGPPIDRIRRLADRLGLISGEEARVELAGVQSFIEDRLMPHEELEEHSIYPTLAKAMGGQDPTAPLSRTHREIFHLIRLLLRLAADLPDTGLGPEELRDIRRVLYSLHAILALHMAQEEELYLSLGDEHPPSEGTPPVSQRDRGAA
jgi:heavy metal translocating P-type ATPase